MAVELRCPAGDSFGTVEIPADLAVGVVLYTKRCRNSRCRRNGPHGARLITFHRWDVVVYHESNGEQGRETFTEAYRDPRELVALIQEMNGHGNAVR